MAFTISFVTIVVRARLSGMDRSVEEAAQDLGANPIETFLRVTLPLILPGVMAGALLAFTLSFDDFVITFFVAGVGSSTLPLKIYSMIKFGVSPVINALSTVVLVATMVLIFGGSRDSSWRTRRNPEHDAERPSESRKPGDRGEA